jgi:rhodanese-related sulfurtransferase
MNGRAFREITCISMLAFLLVMISAIAQHRVRAESDVNARINTGYSVTLEEVRRFPEVLWVDARSRRAYEAEHIPKAILLNAAEWENLVPSFLDAWEPDVPIVVYCDSASCDASTRIAERLRNEMGIENVFVLKDGWETWKKAYR